MEVLFPDLLNKKKKQQKTAPLVMIWVFWNKKDPTDKKIKKTSLTLFSWDSCNFLVLVKRSHHFGKGLSLLQLFHHSLRQESLKGGNDEPICRAAMETQK